MKRSLATFVAISFLSPQVLSAESYVVSSRDTLSEIAYKAFPGPVYGEAGSLKKLLELNPHIKNPDIVLPGEVIKLKTPELKQVEEKISQSNVDERVEVKDTVILQEDSMAMQLEVAPIVGFYRIDTEEKNAGSKASALSDLGYGGSLGWKYHLNEKFSLKLFALVMNYKFNVSQNKTLLKPRSSKADLGVKLHYQASQRSIWGFESTYGQDFLLVGKNITNLEIQKFHNTKLTASYNHLIYQKDKLSITAGVKGGVMIPSSSDDYKIDLGHNYGLDTSFRYQTRFGTIENTLAYRAIRFQTNDIKEMIQETSLSSSFLIDF
jgi:hypothetical protein